MFIIGRGKLLSTFPLGLYYKWFVQQCLKYLLQGQLLVSGNNLLYINVWWLGIRRSSHIFPNNQGENCQHTLSAMIVKWQFSKCEFMSIKIGCFFLLFCMSVKHFLSRFFKFFLDLLRLTTLNTKQKNVFEYTPLEQGFGPARFECVTKHYKKSKTCWSEQIFRMDCGGFDIWRKNLQHFFNRITQK